jgi:hypothetical protein
MADRIIDKVKNLTISSMVSNSHNLSNNLIQYIPKKSCNSEILNDY